MNSTREKIAAVLLSKEFERAPVSFVERIDALDAIVLEAQLDERKAHDRVINDWLDCHWPGIDEREFSMPQSSFDLLERLREHSRAAKYWPGGYGE